jgi:hypothetical protein
VGSESASIGFIPARSNPHLQSSFPFLLVSFSSRAESRRLRFDRSRVPRPPNHRCLPIRRRRNQKGPLRLNNRELNAEIEKIDRAMALLDDERTALVHRLIEIRSRDPTAPKVLHFPGRISVRRLPRESADEWPPGPEATMPEPE